MTVEGLTACFHYSPEGIRCRVPSRDPVAFLCATHVQEYRLRPASQLLDEAAQAILDCTEFTREGLPAIACRNFSSWKRLCNLLQALFLHGYRDQDGLLTLLVGSLESVRGPWRGRSPSTRPGRAFERLVARIYLEELRPRLDARAVEQRESVRVYWNEKLPSLAGGKRQIDVLLRRGTPEGEALTIVECRDHAVEVGEVDAFATLIRHVRATHGVMVSSMGFQEGALRSAAFEGIETRIVQEEDFSPASTRQVVDPSYEFESVEIRLRASRRSGTPSALATVPVAPHSVHMLRSGIIVGTLAEAIVELLATGSPVPGAMPPRIETSTPGAELLLPGGRRVPVDGLDVTVRIAGRRKELDMVLPRRPLSFVVKQPARGTSRMIGVGNLAQFASAEFVAGHFYVSPMAQVYYCAKADASSRARLVLLNDLQHGDKPIDVVVEAPPEAAQGLYRVDDPLALVAMERDLARFKAFAGEP